MRIRASVRKRKGDLRSDGVGHLQLTADGPYEAEERKFISGVYKLVGADSREEQQEGVEWFREYLKSFPPFS